MALTFDHFADDFSDKDLIRSKKIKSNKNKKRERVNKSSKSHKSRRYRDEERYLDDEMDEYVDSGFSDIEFLPDDPSEDDMMFGFLDALDKGLHNK